MTATTLSYVTSVGPKTDLKIIIKNITYVILAVCKHNVLQYPIRGHWNGIYWVKTVEVDKVPKIGLIILI